MVEDGDKPPKVTVKWRSKEFIFDPIDPTITIQELKSELFCLSDVKPERQKLLAKGKNLQDAVTIEESGLLAIPKVMMMGSTEEELEQYLTPPPDMPDVRKRHFTKIFLLLYTRTIIIFHLLSR